MMGRVAFVGFDVAAGGVASLIGCGALVLFVVLVAVASVVDFRARRIPNACVLAAAVLWVAARIAFGVCAGSAAAVFAGAMAPWGLTAFDGVAGAVVLGGGVLIATVAFEALSGRAAMGGGDIKLLAVVGLFLGWERGLICLFAACVVAVAVSLARQVAGSPDDGMFPFAPAILVGTVVALLL